MSSMANSLRRGVVIFSRKGSIHGKDRLKALEDRCHFTYVEPTTRDDVIRRLQILASERVYEALLFFPGFWEFKPWDKDFFKPFVGNLKLVTTPSAGYDHVDVNYLTQVGAYLANAPAAVAEPTAMTALMLILQTVRNTTHAEMTLRRGKWRTGLGFTDDIRDMTIGIIGNGRIGQLVQKKLQALGAGRILYYNRHRLPTSETRHLLSDPQFELMKKGSYVVNTSRGPVIDEAALVRAMKNEQIARVGLDVFENEPDVHPYLMQSERATLFPHWGSSVKRVLPDVDYECLDNLEQWLSTGVPNTPVNKPLQNPKTD